MKYYRGLLLGLLAALLVVVGIRLFVGTLVVIPQEGARPALHAGDRVWVSKWGEFRRCQWAAFHNPADSTEADIARREVFVGFLFALPGDTIWMNRHGDVSHKRLGRSGYLWPLVLPGRGVKVKIEPWNARIYERTIRLHEGIKAAVIGDSLCVRGRMVKTYRFKHDYYWATTGSEASTYDSRRFGFVPASHLIGPLTHVLYSFPPSRAGFDRLLPTRLGLRVSEGCAHCPDLP